MSNLNEMVLGFIFDADKEVVLLIEKTRPSWQAGKLTGIGGRIEDGETITQAMVRECREETGLTIEEREWHHFATMQSAIRNVNWMVYVFYVIEKDFAIVSNPTNERLLLGYADMIDPNDNHIVGEFVGEMENSTCIMISNLTWLIPLAINSSNDNKLQSVNVLYYE